MDWLASTFRSAGSCGGVHHSESEQCDIRPQTCIDSYSDPSGGRRTGLQLDRCVCLPPRSEPSARLHIEIRREMLYGSLHFLSGRLSSSSSHIACTMSIMACGGSSACIHRFSHVAWGHEDVMRCQLVSLGVEWLRIRDAASKEP